MGSRSTRMPRRAAALFAAAVAVGVVLAGCDGEETPTPTPSQTAASSSPSATPTTTSAAPSPSPSSEVPEAARQQTDAGAEAFVKYFFDQVNDAWMAPNPDLIQQISDDGCKSCEALAKTATDLEAGGQRYEDVPIDVIKISASDGAPKGQVYLDASLVQNRADVVDGDGKVVLTDPRKAFDRTVALRWVGDRWLVYALV